MQLSQFAYFYHAVSLSSVLSGWKIMSFVKSLNTYDSKCLRNKFYDHREGTRLRLLAICILFEFQQLRGLMATNR